MKKISVLILTLFLFIVLNAQEKVNLSGRVTDFLGNPIDSALMRVKDRNFNNPFQTYSNSDGYFLMKVEKENYNCIYTIRVSDYRKTKLEYCA